MSLEIDRTVCEGQVGFNNDEDDLIWICLTAMILALISFISIGCYFWGMAGHLKKLQI